MGPHRTHVDSTNCVLPESHDGAVGGDAGFIAKILYAGRELDESARPG